MIFYYYKITNIKNGSFYVGITTDPSKRRTQHFNELKNNRHCNYKMQKDYNKFGEQVFVFEVIETLKTESKEEAYQHEYNLIQNLQATSSYNILEGGNLNPVYSEQVIEKIKKTHQGKYDNVLQYRFENNSFVLENVYNGLRRFQR